MNITRARFIGVVLAQAGSAFFAAATAALISSRVDSGSVAIASPVAGLNTGWVRVLTLVTSWPPMAF